MKLALLLKAEDYASRVMDKLRSNVNKASKDIENQAVRSGKRQQDTVKRTAQITEQSYRKAQQASRALARDRESLGIRSENAIQREINQTIAAYQRLKASGMVSSRELARAAEMTRQKISSLNAEMGRTPMGQRLGNWGRNLASMTIGIGAGAAVAIPKIKNAADYDLALANIANTAYSGKSIKEKTEGKKKTHNAIKEALTYGGTKEDALIAINKLIGEGNVSVDDAQALLPTIQKNATATGSTTSDIAGLVNALLNFNVKVEDIQKALDYANASGKAGGFELKDMAQYAPEFLSQAKNSGLSGLDDLKQVLKGAQQTYKVSGGAAQTSTNLVNFFSKLRSPDTVNRFKKVDIYDPKTKKTHGVDLEASMVNEMKARKSPIEAFMQIVDMVLAQDKTYKQLLKKLENAKEGEQQAIAEKIAKYVETTKIGELMPDIQASAAMFAMRRDKNTAANVDEQYQIAEQGSFNQSDFDFIQQQNAFKFQKVKNDAEMKSIENWNGANNQLGKVADWVGENMEEFPNFTNAIVGATDALQIFGAGLAGFSLLDILSKSNGGGGSGSGGINSGSRSVKGGFALANSMKMLAISGAAVTLLTSTEDDKTGQLVDLMHKVDSGNATDEEKNALTQQISQAREEAKLHDALYNTGDELGAYFTRKSVEMSYMDYLNSRLKKGDISEEIRAKIESRNAYYKEKQESSNAFRFRGGTPYVPASQATVNKTDYQANFEQFGKTISEGLKQAIENQNFVIENLIKVELDGRVVAEHTSERQYQELKRG